MKNIKYLSRIILVLAVAVQSQVLPSKGDAVVDGVVSEWTQDDDAADLLKAGFKEKLGELYLRYDCAEQVMYAYVKYTDGQYILAENGEEVYIKVDGFKAVSSDHLSFAWVGLNGDQAEGWEASFALMEGLYTLDVHTNVWEDNESQTMKAQLNVLIECEYDYGDATGTPPAYNVMDPNRIRLGGTVDNETLQQEDGFCAGGDDALDGSDDEDGVVFRENGVELVFTNYIIKFQKGKTMQVSVHVYNYSGKNAVLRAWVDYNGDGDFRDDREDLISQVFQNGTDQVYDTEFKVPNEAFVVEDKTVFLRFRLEAVASSQSSGTSSANSDFSLMNVNTIAGLKNTVGSEGRGGYGEVEDYGVQFTGSPIAVVLSEFAARADADLVEISWTSETEFDHAGYNIYRSKNRDDRFVKLNDKMIISAPFSQERKSYTYKDQVPENGDYYYRLEAVNLDGTSKTYGPIAVTVSGVAVTRVSGKEMPRQMRLHGNFPNPFNPVTTISFNLPSQQNIILSVYDIQGRLVSTLLSGQTSAGEHRVVWDATNRAGEPVSSGVYFYRLTSESFNDTRQMTLIR